MIRQWLILHFIIRSRRVALNYHVVCLITNILLASLRIEHLTLIEHCCVHAVCQVSSVHWPNNLVSNKGSISLLGGYAALKVSLNQILTAIEGSFKSKYDFRTLEIVLKKKKIVV